MVALGGALGSVGRFGLGQALARLDSFPYGTLLANVLGSLVIGICAGLFDAEEKSRPAGIVFDGRFLRRLHDVFHLQPSRRLS